MTKRTKKGKKRQGKYLSEDEKKQRELDKKEKAANAETTQKNAQTEDLPTGPIEPMHDVESPAEFQAKEEQPAPAYGWKKAVIRIELRSDLCVSSGYSFAGIIDSDVCYDYCGIPYIPAKRLRGCFRETLEGSLYAVYPGCADRLFGKAGENCSARVIIGNAYIENYEAFREMLLEKKKSNAAVYYDTQSVLERFTHVLGQTRIDEDGIAQDNSLRYTRVINHTSPFTEDEQPLTFFANISFYEAEPQGGQDQIFSSEEVLKASVEGTRHIGLKRNRGFGNVQCSLEQVRGLDSVEPGETYFGSEDENREKNAKNKTVKICVRVRNTAPLMLSAETEDTSEAYISGQSFLGAVAGRYLELADRSAEDEAFQDLFLNGRTIFSNLYPSDGTNVYEPAPVYINSLKKTKKYVCVLKKQLPDFKDKQPGRLEFPEGIPEKDIASYNPADGNQPKKLKGKFTVIDSRKGYAVAVHEVKRDIVYHHSHYKKGADGQEGLLYGMEVVSPNQLFEGFILVPEAYASLVITLLTAKGGDIYFGKSRSSQYGCCRVEKAELAEKDQGIKKIPAGKHLVVTFLSDALFLADRGEYTVYKEELEKLVLRELAIPPSAVADDVGYLSSILTTRATGYFGVWNLRKIAQPAVMAGSCLVYKLNQDFEIRDAELFIGERNLEGYGQVRIDCAENIRYGLEELDTRTADSGSKKSDSKVFNVFLKNMLAQRWLDQCVYVYFSQTRKKTDMSNSQLSRITLMLKESLESNKTDYEPEKKSGTEKPCGENIERIKADYDRAEAAFDDFQKRIKSIKTEEVKKDALDILEAVSEKNKLDSEKNKLELGFASKYNSQKRDIYNEQVKDINNELAKCIGQFYTDKLLDSKWGEFMLIILTELKYAGGKNNG